MASLIFKFFLVPGPWFCPKSGPEIRGCFNLLENLVIIFFWIWSIAKVFINCSILAQMPYLRKIWYVGQNALGQSDFRIFKSTFSSEKIVEKAWFYACWYRFMEIKSWLKKILQSARPKMRVSTLVSRLWSHLAVSEEAIVGINWFLYDGTSSGKLKISLIIFGWRWSKMGEIDEINWFVACWCKFSKAKSCFNNCWMNMVKNGRGLKK